MRLLLAVTHYFRPGDGRHGSLGQDPRPRVEALRQLVLQLQRLFAGPAATLNHMARRIDAVDDGAAQLDLRLCVTGDAHVLTQLQDLSAAFRVEWCEPSDPKLLGFETQRVLAEAHAEAEAAGSAYDYVGYLEDDILITDADFFLKLRAFNAAFGDDYLLMPNRIETAEHPGQLRRFYIDGDYYPPATETYRQSQSTRLCLQHLGESVCFDQPYNLHSGCFFLNAGQARSYFASEHSRSLDASFHGPLESAATLGMLRSFQVMKPCLTNGRFLTVEHAGRNFMGLVQNLS